MSFGDHILVRYLVFHYMDGKVHVISVGNSLPCMIRERDAFVREYWLAFWIVFKSFEGIRISSTDLYALSLLSYFIASVPGMCELILYTCYLRESALHSTRHSANLGYISRKPIPLIRMMVYGRQGPVLQVYDRLPAS